MSADDAARIRRVEFKLDMILEHLGLTYTEGDGELPDEVSSLADLGDKIGAIKAYRTATGGDLADAKAAVESYMARRRGGGGGGGG